MQIAGIDYSMNGTGICVYSTNRDFTFKKCNFFYMTNRKSLDGMVMSNVEGFYFDGSKSYTNDIKRFDVVSDWVMRHLKYVDVVAIEGYSMGSRGRVFEIAENTALLKYKLMKQNIDYHIYAPTSIKKFAMDNTNIDLSDIKKNRVKKDVMYKIFVEETGVDLQKLLIPKAKKLSSPVTDIIDSYYICKKLLFENIDCLDK